MSRGWRCVYPSSRLFAIPITHPWRAKFVGHLSKYLCYSLQEAQLSQWDRATLRVIVGRVYCMSLLIFYWNCISYHFWDIQRQRMEWPWNRGSGSFKVIENGAVRWIIYDFLLVVLCCTIFDLFDVEWYHDLENWVRGHSRSFKPVPFESLGAVSYSPSTVTMALYCIICEIKRDIGRKSWFFHTPLHSMPPIVEYCRPFSCGKTSMMGLANSEKSLRICLTV